ncbi:MAG TPA: hypothetical protein DD730_18815 [Desulfosporosinus sp.]|jgi:hypothetical protein|nr:hypothetical protein [Desulfosporosinus sp.]
MARVFIVQENDRFVFTNAEKFGTIVYLQGFYQIEDEGQAEAAADHMAAKLEDFNSEIDYLLLVGDPILISIASALISHTTEGIYSVLKWDRQTRSYKAILIDIGAV